MYLGRFVESGPTARAVRPPAASLYACAARGSAGSRSWGRTRHIVLAGDVPSPLAPPPGCRFHTRCPHAIERCRTEIPADESTPDGGTVACHRWRELDPAEPVIAGQPENPVLARLQAAFIRGNDTAGAPDL